MITLVLYSGHAGGEEEKNAIINYCSTLSQEFYTVLLYEMINWVNHPPALVSIEKNAQTNNDGFSVS